MSWSSKHSTVFRWTALIYRSSYNNAETGKLSAQSALQRGYNLSCYMVSSLTDVQRYISEIRAIITCQLDGEEMSPEFISKL